MTSTRPSAVSGRHVALNITRRCNQRCVFCFEGERKGWSEPSLDKVISLMSEAGERGFRHIVFMGAEALMRKDILQIVRQGRSMGLYLSAFTNGQVLADHGFVCELREAGLEDLQVSFHYADAPSFAEGTRTRPRAFERLLEGLGNIHRFNSENPDSRFHITVETDLCSFNFQRLDEMGSMLSRTLGEDFRSWHLGMVLPAPTRYDKPLLEPLSGRREELVGFLPEWSRKTAIVCSKLPLCLIPGWEHLSLDILHMFFGRTVCSNFEDKSAIGPMHDFVRMFRRNPFRWVCRDCSLLPICTTARTDWTIPAFLPGPGQMPVPARDTDPWIILDRIRAATGKEPVPFSELLSLRLSGSLPEHDLFRALGAELEIRKVGIDQDLYFELELEPKTASEEAPRIRLGPVQREMEAGSLVEFMDLRVGEHGEQGGEEDTARIFDLVERSLPDAGQWVDCPRFDAGTAAAAHEVQRFLGSAWRPGSGSGRFGPFKAQSLKVDSAGTFVFGLQDPGGGKVELRLSPADPVPQQEEESKALAGQDRMPSSEDEILLFLTSDLAVSMAFRAPGPGAGGGASLSNLALLAAALYRRSMAYGRVRFVSAWAALMLSFTSVFGKGDFVARMKDKTSVIITDVRRSTDHRVVVCCRTPGGVADLNVDLVPGRPARASLCGSGDEPPPDDGARVERILQAVLSRFSA